MISKSFFLCSGTYLKSGVGLVSARAVVGFCGSVDACKYRDEPSTNVFTYLPWKFLVVAVAVVVFCACQCRARRYEHYGLDQLVKVNKVTVLSSGNTVESTVVTTADVGTSMSSETDVPYAEGTWQLPPSCSFVSSLWLFFFFLITCVGKEKYYYVYALLLFIEKKGGSFSSLWLAITCTFI
jgi:hypothetical protein